MSLDELRFPVGHYKFSLTQERPVEGWIGTIAEFPESLRRCVAGLSYEELTYRYRPGGWNITQVVHHLADSHMNGFIRFKLVQTEDSPTIRPYNEQDWAETEDASDEEVSDSLELLDGLHKRWTAFLKSRKEADWSRVFSHPEYDELKTMVWMLGLYDWHCRHHLAHIQQAIELAENFTQ